MGIFDFFRASSIKAENETLKNEVQRLNLRLKELGADEFFQVKEKIHQLESESNIKLSQIKEKIVENENHFKTESQKTNEELNSYSAKKQELSEEVQKLYKQVVSSKRKIDRSKELYKSINYTIDNFFTQNSPEASLKLSSSDLLEIEEISPSVILKLHCMDMKELRKAYRENERLINKLLDQYSSRYTTKANKAIYNLMVIALKAELQNILYSLKYEKLDVSIENIKKVTEKYLSIAGEGNQNIIVTLTKFIGEIEYLFINAIKIEYNYYVKKEQSKQEQLMIREQMRQEAEERKALEAEKKKIEKEESKFNSEIQRLTEQLQSVANDEAEKLKQKILDLENQLAQVIVKKADIASLQNGKAGNVYVISNLGSFGEDVFKIGMTRRLDPQDRVNELGDASVPFRFDVHSFIFSEDAVSLESKLHQMLNEKRLNKVNLRKEFFNVSLDDLEELIINVEPTAEFNRTMLAEEYRQSLSSNDNYIVDESIVLEDEDE